jgi:hypothetical protein
MKTHAQQQGQSHHFKFFARGAFHHPFFTFAACSAYFQLRFFVHVLCGSAALGCQAPLSQRHYVPVRGLIQANKAVKALSEEGPVEATAAAAQVIGGQSGIRLK